MTGDEQALLSFAALTWQHAGARDTAIRHHLGLTPTEYHRRLHYLIDRPEALAADPVLVNRLRRLRDQRRPWRRAGAA